MSIAAIPFGQLTTVQSRPMRIPLFRIDAFTQQPFTGNPAAVCVLQGWLDDAMLQKVAAENNLSETAFLVPNGDHYDLRWFTSRGEVKLCGHATLASGYVVFNVLQPGVKSVQFDTRFSGTLTVCQEGDMLSLNLPAIFPKTCANPPDILISALGNDCQWLRVLEGNETYLVVYDNESSIKDMRLDFALLEKLHPHTVAITAPGRDVDFVSRYFKPSYGMLEDPVTGSAHCLLTPYWSSRLGKLKLHARQLSERGGELWCELAEKRVILKGHAALTMSGTLIL
jgi:PhzF family phenazine biosynthesis protein